jgi:cysteine-rich repeat protein
VRVLRAASATVVSAVVFSAAALPSGCTDGPDAKEERQCTPNKKVFCRCRDRGQGEALCNSTGTGWASPCEPCETIDNPVIPYRPPPRDASFWPDASDDAPEDPCGNGVVDEGEDCDDQNEADTDGCDKKCKIAGLDPFATRSCPGLDVHVWSHPVVYDGATIGAPLVTKIDPSCPSDQGNVPTRGDAGPERIFRIVAHKTGTLTAATSETDFDSFLFFQQTCATGDYVPYSACTNKAYGLDGESISIPVQAGNAYTLVVDGAGIDHFGGGYFRLTLKID